MTKSYKMVTLQAMFREGVFQRAVSAAALCQHFRAHFAKEQYRHDIDGTAIADIHGASERALLDYLRKHPINAWVGGNTGEPSPWFEWSEPAQSLIYIGPQAEDTAAFSQAVWQRVEWRLHDYLTRPGPSSGLYKVIGGGGSALSIMLGDNGPAKLCTRTVKINGRYLYGFFKKVAVNKLGESDDERLSSQALMTAQLRILFGDVPAEDVAGHHVRITRLPGEDCLLIERGI